MSAKVRDIGFEEEHQHDSVPIVLKMIDVASNDRNTVGPQLTTIPNDVIINLPVEPDVDIPLRRSQLIRPM